MHLRRIADNIYAEDGLSKRKNFAASVRNASSVFNFCLDDSISRIDSNKNKAIYRTIGRKLFPFAFILEINIKNGKISY